MTVSPTLTVRLAAHAGDLDASGHDTVAGGSTVSTWLAPVRVATTASVTISTALNAGDSIDGVTLASGDRVLVRAQSTASGNGIYVAGTTPARATDFDASAEIIGATVLVREGTLYAETVWACANDTTVTVGTTSINFRPVGFLAWTTNAAARLLPDYSSITQPDGDTRTSLNLDGNGAFLSGKDTMELAVNNNTSGGPSTAKHYFYGGHGLVVPQLAADPSGANVEQGQLYFNTATKKFRGYNGTTWGDLN